MELTPLNDYMKQPSIRKKKSAPAKIATLNDDYQYMETKYHVNELKLRLSGSVVRSATSIGEYPRSTAQIFKKKRKRQHSSFRQNNGISPIRRTMGQIQSHDYTRNN